jgi:2-oxoglutarate ferredoxin oxidoreductase subunit alpha
MRLKYIRIYAKHMNEPVCVGLLDDTINILIGGEAGQGVTRSGSLLSHALMRSGLHVFGTNEYPSLIRGGHNYYQLRTAVRPVYAQSEHLDILVALNKETVTLHESELNPGGDILFDESNNFSQEELGRKDLHLYKVPMTSTVKELGGPDIMRNTVALGAIYSLLNLTQTTLSDVITTTFTKPEVIEMNLNAVEHGYQYMKEKYNSFGCTIKNPSKTNRIILTGNDAVALGAVSAGLKFFSAYPMTPASPILDWMINNGSKAGVIAVQAESELAAMNMVVGASYAGVRAMTATSGGGFSLMTEALGFAAMSENPIVINIGQRPGPSTGLATHSGQGDLLFAIHASQGEFPRVVLAPGDIEECYYLTKQAFNLAEKYQIPVIILTDKYLAESERDVESFDEVSTPIDRGKTNIIREWSGPYNRYSVTEDGVSPRLTPGTRGAIINATSNEHTETGYTTSDPNAVIEMMKKRFRKVPLIVEEVEGLNPVRTYGAEDADATIISWGGNKGPILEAMKHLKEKGVKTRLVQVVYLEPFPRKKVKEELEKTPIKVLFESNVTAQLSQLIKMHTAYTFENIGLRYDGRPFNPSDIVTKVTEATHK